MQHSQMGIVVLDKRHGMGQGCEGFVAEIGGKNDATEFFRTPLPRDMRPNGQHRNRRLPKDLFGHRPHEQFWQAGAAMGAQQQQVDLIVLNESE